MGRWACEVTHLVRYAPLWHASWMPAVDKSRGSKSAEVLRVWEVHDDWLQFMAMPAARRLDPAVLDARCYLSGVCRRWYRAILDLLRFFIAISRAVVNHDGREGTALDPLIWSAGVLPKRRRVVDGVRNHAVLPGAYVEVRERCLPLELG